MKYNYILLIIALFLFTQCDNSDKKDIIEQDKFIDILVDIHIADAIISNKGFYDGNLKDSTKSYYNYVLKKHNISRASFDKSMEYYSKDTESYLKLYDKVIAIISKQVPVRLHKESVYNILQMAIDVSKKPTKK